ncbi:MULTISPECIES: hypothetical protein [Arthrobacter]|uniref:phosphoribosyltransferase-like protein n=1 Tax=Arthrobacter TaxID=1663 RepID=UPI0012645F8D|nr:hypothetical protein [Arthrobacter citreus]
MELSKTRRAAEWLKQFEVDDQAAAMALLDGVRFLQGGEVITGIRRSIEELLVDHQERFPVALVPIISSEDMIREEGADDDAELTTFSGFNPAQPIANNPGSEALVAQLVREVRNASPSAAIFSAPLTLEGMRTSKVHTLLCVTDYIGSGQQVLDYVETWCRNRTISSWRSFKWLQIGVVAYAATSAGKSAVEASPYINFTKVTEIAPSIREIENSYLGAKVLEVCRVYAKRGKIWPPLGYRDSGGLFASSFSVPNNLPAILIKRSKRWEPFFDGRSVSTSLSDEIGSHVPGVNIPQQLFDAGQVRLAARHRDGHIDRPWQTHMIMLGLLPRTEEQLALALGIHLPAVRAILVSLERLQLIDAQGRPSSAGFRALASHRRKPRRTPALLTPDPSPYYPRYRS